MTDTSKTDNMPTQNDISKNPSSQIPVETPGVNSSNIADSFPQNNSEVNAFEQPLGEDSINIPLSSSSPSVIVPGKNGKVPKWFYLIFILTLIIFIAVTTLLVKSMVQRSNNAISNIPTVSPVITKPVTTVTIPAIIPSPTIEATDAGTLKISQVSNSDEINDIENDIKTTDFSSIETGLSRLDSELDFKTSL
jgi:hypothetical protein